MADADPPTEPAYIYDAFISYRHVERDSKWAKWLIDALERYRVPKELQERGCPPRLRKIFRDEDEVPASGDLNDQIRQALVASRFLIVVCSPYTPRSVWVQREIEIFNELGRGDQVLALLTEGEPGDSFPNPMLERHREVTDPDGTVRIVKEAKEPLAADVRPRTGVSMEHRRWTALLRLVAVILEVKYDDLYHRERQRERARKFRWASAAAALLLAAGIGGFFYWNMERPKIAHYRDLIYRREIPEGLTLIDDQTRAHLSASYQFTTLHGKVVEVRYQNSAGSLVDSPTAGIARSLINYRNDGFLDRIDTFDASNRLLLEELYERDPATNRLITNLKRGTAPIAQDALFKNIARDYAIGSFKGNTEVTRRELTFDESGFAIEYRYQDYFGTPRPDATGSFGQSLQYSPAGLPTRVAQLGSDGAEITNKSGVSATTYTYDRDNRKIRTATFGPDNKPVDQNEYAVEMLEYGSDGNLALYRYFDAGGKPVKRDGLCAMARVAYDEHGNLTEFNCLNSDSKLTLSKDGSARSVKRYDARGYKIEDAYFGIDGKPRSGSQGCAKIVQAVDSNGRITQLDCYGADGNPGVGKSGNARVTSSYDSRGNLTERSFFAVDGRPVLTAPTNCARTTVEFDANDNLRVWNCFGLDGKPAPNPYGVARATFGYDPRGNRISEDYSKADGKPVLAIGCQCAHFRQTYDRNGDTVEVRFAGIDGEPINGIERSVYRYDDKGNQTELSTVGADGKPVLNIDGFAKAIAAYDSHARMVRESYFGIDDRPVLSHFGYAAVSNDYDSRGKPSRRVFLGVDGKPVQQSNNCAGYAAVNDVNGLLEETTCLGLHGEPVVNSNGFATLRETFDERKHLIEMAFLDTDGKLILTEDGYAGYRQSFADRDKPTEKAYFGVDHKLVAVSGVARTTFAYDAAGNLIENATFGIDGKPFGAVARSVSDYDDWNQETAARYFDAAGREVPIEVFISQVAPDAVAAQINLAAGDRIISYGGHKMTSTRQMITATTDPRLGAQRRLDIVRGRQSLTFEVPAGKLGIVVNHRPAKL